MVAYIFANRMMLELAPDKYSIHWSRPNFFLGKELRINIIH
jgi:hypothetical protein